MSIAWVSHIAHGILSDPLTIPRQSMSDQTLAITMHKDLNPRRRCIPVLIPQAVEWKLAQCARSNLCTINCSYRRLKMSV